MLRRSPFFASFRVLRSLGANVAMSLAVSAVTAALMATQGLFGLAAKDPLVEAQRLPGGIALTGVIAPDGKIQDRHRDESGTADRAGAGVLLPAALAMPMNSGWPEADFGEAVATASRVAVAHPKPAAGVAAVSPRQEIALVRPKTAATALPPLRPAETVEAAPIRQVTVAQTVALEAAPTPIRRVGNAVSSAVGSVGAAGLWTLSQASSLLPRL